MMIRVKAIAMALFTATICTAAGMTPSSPGSPILHVPPQGIVTFPFKTSNDFFQGARTVVDLGSGYPHRAENWTAELAQRYPNLAIHGVDNHNLYSEEPRLKPQVANLTVHEYDYLKPPLDHAQGDRVTLNSPFREDDEPLTAQNADEYVHALDAHLLSGGYAYSVFDCAFLQGASFDFARERILLNRFVSRMAHHFGPGNAVLNAPLSGYSRPEQLDADPGPSLYIPYTLQIRKP